VLFPTADGRDVVMVSRDAFDDAFELAANRCRAEGLEGDELDRAIDETLRAILGVGYGRSH
jgi:hypothetical protein